VIFNDGVTPKRNPPSNSGSKSSNSNPSYHQSPDERYTGDSDPCYFLAHLLSYLETPPHLRRSLFGFHPDLRTAGSLPSLDMPHHGWPNDLCRYREGVTVPSPTPFDQQRQQQEPLVKKQKRSRQEDETSIFVDAGLSKHVSIPDPLPITTRVTIQFDGPVPTELQNGAGSCKNFPSATPVAPTAPREEGGFYWGYTIRVAPSLTAVFTECPFEGGYDVSIGTSERGLPLTKMSTELPQVSRCSS